MLSRDMVHSRQSATVRGRVEVTVPENGARVNLGPGMVCACVLAEGQREKDEGGCRLLPVENRLA